MDYITKLFDENSAAEKMIQTGKFSNGGTIKELTVLAKYFKKEVADYYGLELSEYAETEEIEERVKKFCEHAIPYYDYYNVCLAIDRAVHLAEKYKLNINDPTPITQKEWAIIQTIKNEYAKRLLFMQIVDAKYYAAHRKTIGKMQYSNYYYSRENITRTMYCREMKIPKKEYYPAMNELYKNGVIEFTEIHQGYDKPGKWLNRVTCIDNDPDAEIIDYVTDYHNLLLHYERLCGADIGECKKCGRLFQQQYRNKYKYCEEHRTTNRKKVISGEIAKVEECVDCGSFFDIPKMGNTSQMIRCKECQNKINKQKKIEWMKEKRMNVEMKS